MSSFKDNFSQLHSHSALDETTSTLAILLGVNNYPNPHQYENLRASRGKVEFSLQEIDIIKFYHGASRARTPLASRHS